MKKSLLKIIGLLMIFGVIILINPSRIFAASLGIAANRSSVTAGESFTVNVSGNGLTGRVNLSANGAGASISKSSVWVEDSTVSVTVTTSSEGTVTISGSGVLADSTTADESTYSKSCSVKVNAKVAPATATTQEKSKSTTKKSTNTTKSTTNTAKVEEPEEATPQLGVILFELYAINENGDKNLISLDKAFDINTLEYTCNVGSDIKNVEVIADAKEYNDVLKIDGADKELAEGENIVTLTLTQNDTVMTYKITIIKEAAKVEEIVQESEDKPVKEKWYQKTIQMPIIWFSVMQIAIVGIEIGCYFAIKKLIKMHLGTPSDGI